MGKIQYYFGLTLVGFLLAYFYKLQDWRLFLLLGLPAALTGYSLAAYQKAPVKKRKGIHLIQVSSYFFIKVKKQMEMLKS